MGMEQRATAWGSESARQRMAPQGVEHAVHVGVAPEDDGGANGEAPGGYLQFVSPPDGGFAEFQFPVNEQAALFSVIIMNVAVDSLFPFSGRHFEQFPVPDAGLLGAFPRFVGWSLRPTGKRHPQWDWICQPHALITTSTVAPAGIGMRPAAINYLGEYGQGCRFAPAGRSLHLHRRSLAGTE